MGVDLQLGVHKISQGVRSGTDDKVLKAKMSLLWAGPFKFWPLALVLKHLMERLWPTSCCTWTFRRIRPARIPIIASPWSVANLARTHTTPRTCRDFFRLALLSTVRFKQRAYTTNSPPYHVVTEDHVSAPVQRLDVEQITGHDPWPWWRYGRSIRNTAVAWYTPPFLGARDRPPTFKTSYFAVLVGFSQSTPYHKPTLLPRYAHRCGHARTRLHQR